MGVTDDRNTPGLGHGSDESPVPMNDVYLVLSDDERAKGFVRPLRTAYVHTGGCGTVTTMAAAIAETYARAVHVATAAVRRTVELRVTSALTVSSRGRTRPRRSARKSGGDGT